MKLRVSKEKFLDGLQQVINVITTRTTLPILQNVLIQTSKNRIEFSTTDLDISITCWVEAEVLTDGSTTLPAKKLLSIIREMPSQDIDLEVDGKNQASLRCGQSFFKIVGLPKDDFPPSSKLENAREIKLPQATLRDMIRKTGYAISHDETRYVLNGIYMSFRDKKLTIVATDGRRLALADTDLDLAPSQEADIILPTKAVNELQRLLGDEGDITLTFTETRAAFDFGGIYLVTKLTDGKYPNYKQVIPSQTKERVTLERETFLNTVRRVSLIVTDKNGSIKFSFSPDMLSITAISPEVGEARETIPIKYRGKEFSIAFNPEFVSDVLRNLNSDEVHFEFQDELSPGVIRLNTPNFLYVIMPMRVG